MSLQTTRRKRTGRKNVKSTEGRSVKTYCYRSSSLPGRKKETLRKILDPLETGSPEGECKVTGLKLENRDKDGLWTTSLSFKHLPTNTYRLLVRSKWRSRPLPRVKRTSSRFTPTSSHLELISVVRPPVLVPTLVTDDVKRKGMWRILLTLIIFESYTPPTR